MKATLSRKELRHLCEQDLAEGHDRKLTTQEVSVLYDWAKSTVKRYVYDKPPMLASVKIGEGKLQIPRRRIPYTVAEDFFNKMKA